jgi:hypothetical protein
MRFLFSNIVGAIIRLVVITAISVFLAAYQLSPQGVAEALLNNPPQWTTNPLVRLAALLLGGAIVALLLNWERLFATPLDRDRRALVNRAFSDLPPDVRDWLIQHHAGGRPPGEFGEVLYGRRLIDRDFVGWTGVRPELQPLVATRIHAYQSLLTRLLRRVAKMTTYGIVVACLLVSITASVIALIVLIREHRGTGEKTASAAEPHPAPPQQASSQPVNTVPAPAQPPQSQPRAYSDRTVGELLTFYEGRTPFQAEALMEPYKGKWIIAEGKAINLIADSQPRHSIAVLQSGRFTIECRLDSRWATIVARLNKGDAMKVEGKIGPYQNGSQLYLADCELVSDQK